jgi:hypothetical protein
MDIYEVNWQRPGTWSPGVDQSPSPRFRIGASAGVPGLVRLRPCRTSRGHRSSLIHWRLWGIMTVALEPLKE